MRIRSVRLVRHALQHTALAALLLALPLLLDKSGLLPWSDWRATGIHRAGAWTPPGVGVPPSWVPLLLGALLLALASAWLRARLLRITDTQAAVALESRTGTKERITSAAVLGEAPLPLAGALVEDAARAAGGVDVNQAFPLHAGRAGRWCAGTLGVLLLLLFVLPELDLRGLRAAERAAEEAKRKDRETVTKLAERLRQQARNLKRQRETRPPPEQEREIAALTKRMEKLAREMERDSSIDARKAKSMMNRLQEELKQEARASAGMTNRFTQLPVPDKEGSLLRDTIRNLKEGDARGARQALQRLRQKLAKLDRIPPSEMRQLATEARALAETLDREGMKDLAGNFAQMARALEELQKQGAQEALSRLESENPVLAEAMRNLMAGGEPPPGGLDLSQLSEEDRMLLQEIMQALAEMQQGMDGAGQQLAARDSQAQTREITTEDLLEMLKAIEEGRICPNCQGEGCQACNIGLGGLGGLGVGSGTGGLGVGSGTGGIGQGRGGVPPERESETDFVRTPIRARQLDRGRIVGQWLVRGLPPKDDATRAEYLEAVEAAKHAPDVVRERESIPVEDRDLVRDYQNAIRGLD